MHSFDDPHFSPYWPTWPRFSLLTYFTLFPTASKYFDIYKLTEKLDIFLSSICSLTIRRHPYNLMTGFVLRNWKLWQIVQSLWFFTTICKSIWIRNVVVSSVSEWKWNKARCIIQTNGVASCWAGEGIRVGRGQLGERIGAIRGVGDYCCGAGIFYQFGINKIFQYQPSDGYTLFWNFLS